MLVLAGCGQSTGSSEPSPQERPSAPAPDDRAPADRAPDPDAALTCTTGADCPSLACGPCAPGTPVTELFVRVNCGHNPCPGVYAECENGICVVHAPSAERERLGAEPMTCQSDSDCPDTTCGPCEDGARMTRSFGMIGCRHDPCPAAVSRCEQEQCVRRYPGRAP
ncbi:MAG: hypothetical protein K8H88_09745 [Sandaracinaceae bacterium]|nr:hypothetical protein [Sandaracinaceae bacterium]